MGKGFEAFMKNPFWRGYYESAPTAKVKEYIALGFEYSAREEDEEEQYYADKHREALASLSKEEVQWLYDNQSSGMQKSVYKKMLLAMEEAEQPVKNARKNGG